ncbi:hypothetical protein KI659_17745 [Litoribacter alkaliphilus]|uniref:Uncharacterized protein n=1 Tax=Litoribacter ruber TaxID=702568 RepID=A0AAP2CLE0_9BACT|nr:hypothetical protein [Litoribacter alkaliphilus]MBS9525869.1 hypothetical protein [Litoribacter alkaliphilus]
MNQTIQEKQSEHLQELLSEIRQDVEEITAMAAEVSEKFTAISKDIRGMSKTFTKAFKDERAGQIVEVAGYAVEFLGKGFSSIKKEYQLMKLLPKKQALAKAKRPIIQQHILSLEERLPRLKKLLIGEATREYLQRAEFEALHGKDIRTAFEMYTFTTYLYEVCSFMIREFDAWDNENHDSGSPMPMKYHAINRVVNDVLAPNGFTELSNLRKQTGAMYIFSKYPGILGTLFLIKYKESQESKEDLMLSEQNRFMNVKEFYKEVSGIYSKNSGNIDLSWIGHNIYLNQIKDKLNINSMFMDYMKYLLLGVGVFMLILTRNIEAALILSLLFSLIIYSINNGLNYAKDQRFKFQKAPTSELVIGFFLQVISLGTLYYAKKIYKEKEEDYIGYFNNLGNKINI